MPVTSNLLGMAESPSISLNESKSNETMSRGHASQSSVARDMTCTLWTSISLPMEMMDVEMDASLTSDVDVRQTWCCPHTSKRGVHHEQD